MLKSLCIRAYQAVFSQYYLERGLAKAVIQKGIDDPEDADTAAFFGISNCQTGLRGISFGNFLIKQVVQELSQELPQLKYFVTLSPVPGFAQWLQAQRDDEQLPESLRKSLEALETPDWHENKAREEQLKAAIRPLAARYLIDEKNRHGLPLNPVARFHLGNGAELHRINWLGDISDKGFKQAAGLMVNYLYVLDDIERNHENYTAKATVACSNEVRDLARRARKLVGRDHQMSHNLFETFAAKMRERTDADFITTRDGRRYSYTDALTQNAQLAGALTELGVKQGDRVAVQVDKSPEAILLYLACLRIGGVYLPPQYGLHRR
ncbi:hypothetical protein HSBAA_58110 [Vreelandella sulfidaeris]|uniref:AMP-dependent synthetase/ligase domain-containing protein n=1 Tax=Vreelandella sulfidaeris TaxID=115553 RepID=A0A455UEH7_9GAMM|nr:hypothetical protein HSBAA_58110 [Halomonas sulfidaeris]